jgi:hypothetical protein
MDIHNLTDFRLKRQSNFNRFSRSDLNGHVVEGVETFFLNVKGVCSSGEVRNRAATGVVGQAAGGRLRAHLKGDAGRGNSDSIFVDDGDR